jgi:hypothetical protein
LSALLLSGYPYERPEKPKNPIVHHSSSKMNFVITSDQLKNYMGEKAESVWRAGVTSIAVLALFGACGAISVPATSHFGSMSRILILPLPFALLCAVLFLRKSRRVFLAAPLFLPS